MSQTTKILAHLKRGKKLTAAQALHYWGCFRLAARINNLREAGHNIHTTMVSRSGKRYAEYRLVRSKANAAA